MKKITLILLSFIILMLSPTPIRISLAEEGSPPIGQAVKGDQLVHSDALNGGVQAVLLRSWQQVNDPNLIFSDLNANWAAYGDTPINIFDYPDPQITYQGLVDTGADIMIISNPGGGGETYSASEISAIEKYADEGHCVIGTYMVFQFEGHDNRGLLPLFGHENTLAFTKGICSLSYNILETESRLFTNLGAIYTSTGFDEAQIPSNDLTWDNDDLAGARFVAKAPDDRAIITLYDATNYTAIYISSMPEYRGGTQDKQWFYNAITYCSEAPWPVAGELQKDKLPDHYALAAVIIAVIVFMRKNNMLAYT